jgi:K+ transporter
VAVALGLVDGAGLGRHRRRGLGSVGVVYGDIGTSPLYAFREALAPGRADGVLTGRSAG